MSMNGVSAMIRCALFLEDTLGMDVLNIGRSALDRKDSCTLEACGRHLSYVILLDGGWVFLSATPLDSLSEPESLLSVADGEGWPTICKLVKALERSGITSLQRPIEIGEGGNPDSWIIA
jgi:hypothetical protein